MEDQGKRLLLAVAIVFLIMMAWSVLFPPDKPEEEPTADAPETAETTPKPGGTADTAAPDAPDAPAPTADEGPRPDEQRWVFDFDRFRAELSSYGGALVSWELKGNQFRDRTADELKQLDLVNTGDREDLRPFQISFPDSTHAIPERTSWELVRKTDTELELRWASPDIEVVKTFQFYPEDFLLTLNVTVRKLSAGEANQALEISLFRFQDPSVETGGGLASSVSLAWTSACYLDEELEWYSAKTLAKKDKMFAGQVQWAGFHHSFFLAAIAPVLEKTDRLTCTARAADPSVYGAMEMALGFPFISKLEQGDTYTKQVTAYYGPKFLEDLEAVPDIVGYDPQFEESVDLGWFAIIARPLMWLLKAFHGVVGNWGLAIIMLTMVVMAITLPWQTKSMRSMRAMAKLRPEIEKLQKKYEGDRQRINVEMMNLYKTHNINPLAGCLPLILQMPVWIALYRSLSVAAELYQAPFIPGWLNDMTAPDPYYILPVLLTGMMFLQTRLTPTTVDSTQQKILMYGMPVMFGFFSLFFPSGLTVYIFTSTLLRIGHQMWMLRNEPKPAAAEAKPAPEPEPDARTDEPSGPKRAAGAKRRKKGGKGRR